jgi:hypothetical protein
MFEYPVTKRRQRSRTETSKTDFPHRPPNHGAAVVTMIEPAMRSKLDAAMYGYQTSFSE